MLQTTLELTDGWYCIKATIDKAMINLVQKGRIFVGQKLCIYGAELVGSDDACSPLEVRLKQYSLIIVVYVICQYFEVNFYIHDTFYRTIDFQLIEAS